jgi:transposase
MSQKLNAAIAVIGIDIGKNSLHIVAHDHRGPSRCGRSGHAAGWKRARQPATVIGMEACVGVHHLSGRLQMLGHDARLMPAKRNMCVRIRRDRRINSEMRKPSPRLSNARP